MISRRLAHALLFTVPTISACGSHGATTTGDAADASDAAAPATLGTPPRREPPAHVVGGFSIHLPSVHLAPGDELTPCFLFPLEPSGESRFVAGGKLTVGPGMHHGNITTRPKTGEGVRSCSAADTGSAAEGADVLAGGTVLFGSSTQISGEEWQSFPDGMAYRVKDGFEIVARMHYLNATGAPLDVAPEYEWYTVDPASVTTEIGPFAWDFSHFLLPPGTTTTVTASCPLAKPMHVVEVLPHMHKLGTAFRATYVGGAKDGQLWLDSSGYDPANGVLRQYDPAVDLSQGTGATFSCTWNNTTTTTLREGIGQNEMCILFGYAWPPANAYTAVASTTGDGTTSTCFTVLPPPP